MTTVLIVDDEVVERQYLCRLFEQASGYQLAGQAGSGPQAVRMAARLAPDIIIMDINMPGSGLEAAAAIRRADPQQIIIINTAYANFEYARQAVELHLDAYLLKPATAEEVLSTVESCLLRRGHSESVSHIRAQLSYPHDIVEALLLSLSRRDAALFHADAQAFLHFLDQQNGWEQGYQLYLLNTVFSLGRGLSRLSLSEEVLQLVDCEGCLSQLRRLSGAELRRLLEDFFRRLALALQPGRPAGQDPVEAVCEYISRHYAEEISLEQLAELAHFSPGYLSRLFHRRMGLTLRAYLSQVRVENAAHMLRHSQRGVNDIALDCGFHNLSHFHRVFKKHTGMTPRELRQEGASPHAPASE